MSEAPQFQHEAVERYLCSVLGGQIRVLNLTRLGEPEEGKGFGYGVPVRVDYEAAGGRRASAVLHTLGPGSFGHEHMADRARILLWSHQAFNRLPRHVRSFDVGGFLAANVPNGIDEGPSRQDSASGAGRSPRGAPEFLIPLGGVEEFCLLTEYAEGEPYALDLQRLRESGQLSDLDVSRADALCNYLVEIHAERSNDARWYIRRNRELVGDGECIMGLADSYPPHSLFTPSVLEQIEHRAVAWRWRLKNRTHRLRRVHGDFHPWNILFSPRAESPIEFHVLDRSRGEYGDPADDVTCITVNYLFFSLQGAGKLAGAFERLFFRFWDLYLEKTGDRELLEVAAPFFVFRALVLASPLWYPEIEETTRAKLLTFILTVLEQERFDPRQVNAYCGA